MVVVGGQYDARTRLGAVEVPTQRLGHVVLPDRGICFHAVTGEDVAHGGEHVVGVQGRLEMTQREIVASLVAARDIQRFQRTKSQQQPCQRGGQCVLLGAV